VRFALILSLLPLLTSLAFAAPPGVVIAHSPTKTKAYIGSPSLAVLPNGEYIASHDFFGPGTKYDTMRVYSSQNQGQTWAQIAEIQGQWWSTLFWHNNALHLIGTTREYGACVIRRSTDRGRTWTTPNDADSGLLLDGKYHCAPVPILIHNGRLWRAMEDYQGPVWGTFRPFMMSIPVDADLLKTSNWTFSNRIDRNPKWLGGQFRSWLEGNAVVTPSGEMVDILRVDRPNSFDEQAAIVRISADGKTATFDERDFMAFPGGSKKFTIRWDATSKKYWTLTNAIPDKFRVTGGQSARTRNTLALAWSTDLRSWTTGRIVLQHADVKTHGFQYVDWLVAGDDLLAVVRTAFDEADGTQAHNAHDANYLTFHRVTDFRK
jgi:hypothetical protein